MVPYFQECVSFTSYIYPDFENLPIYWDTFNWKYCGGNQKYNGNKDIR